MVRATYLITPASNEEKWSSVTNGRTLILIVPHEIYLSDTRACLIFETLALPDRGMIVGVQFAIPSVSVRFKCKQRRVLIKKEESFVDFPNLQLYSALRSRS